MNPDPTKALELLEHALQECLSLREENDRLRKEANKAPEVVIEKVAAFEVAGLDEFMDFLEKTSFVQSRDFRNKLREDIKNDPNVLLKTARTAITRALNLAVTSASLGTGASVSHPVAPDGKNDVYSGYRSLLREGLA